MARYEHLPIYKAAFDLAVHIEKLVQNFSRYHKYGLGAELRARSRRVLERVVEANGSHDRGTALLALRQELECLKVLARLGHEAGVFASAKAYLFVSEQVVGISRQNEGWLRQTAAAPDARGNRRGSGEAAHGQNRKG